MKNRKEIFLYANKNSLFGMKLSQIFTAIVVLLLFVTTFVYAQNIEVKSIGTNSASGRPMYQYDFTIYKGWNLVPPVPFYSSGDRGCGAGFRNVGDRSVPDASNQHIKYAFVWTPTKGYVGGKLNDVHAFNLAEFGAEEQSYLSKIMQGGLVLLYGESGGQIYEPYISTAAMWAYSDKDCVLTAPEGDNLFKLEMLDRNTVSITVQDDIAKDLSYIKLQKGWNIATVLPTMFVGDKVSDYFKDCQVEKFALWNPAQQEWNFPQGETVQNRASLSLPLDLETRDVVDDTIRPEWYYKTFVVKVANECHLSYNVVHSDGPQRN